MNDTLTLFGYALRTTLGLCIFYGVGELHEAKLIGALRTLMMNLSASKIHAFSPPYACTRISSKWGPSLMTGTSIVAVWRHKDLELPLTTGLVVVPTTQSSDFKLNT